MKRSCFARGISFALALVLLFSLASCARSTTDTTETAAQRLTVEKVPVCYTNEQTETFSARLTSLAEQMLSELRGIRLGAQQRKRLSVYMESSVLPMLERENMTAEELLRLCQSMEQIFSAEKSDRTSSLSLLARIYRESMLLLGTDRAGELFYECLLLWADYRLQVYEERYQTYGYEFYLEYSEELLSQREQLTQTVGKENFSFLLSSLFFGASLFSLLTDEIFSDPDVTTVRPAEYLALLQKHRQMLAEHTPSRQQWSVCFSVLTAWVTDSGSTSLSDRWTALQKAEWNAFLTAEHAAVLGDFCVDLSELYQAVAEILTEETLSVLQTGTREQRLQTICLLLSDLPIQTETFLERSSGLQLASDAEKAVLIKYRVWEAYERASADASVASVTDLQQAIGAYGHTPSSETAETLRQTAMRFFGMRCPYLAFVFWTEGGIGAE